MTTEFHDRANSTWSAVEAGCCGGYIRWGEAGFFKITSEVREKLDSESSLPIACAVSLQEIF